MILRITIIVISLSIIFGCSEKIEYKKDGRLEKWYDVLKNEICLNGKKQVDSIDYQIKKNTLYVTHFNHGKKLFQEYRSLDTSRIFVRKTYGENDLFELRSEIHENGILATEGIVFNGNYYGPWTVRFENGQIMYRGYRYKDQDFGDWIYYTENGKMDSLVHEGLLSLADSILKNKNLHTTKPKLH